MNFELGGPRLDDGGNLDDCQISMNFTIISAILENNAKVNGTRTLNWFKFIASFVKQFAWIAINY